jgi:2-oxo-4-hydroxy-4-carboxy-5-ureidoimidazoline decarboxylase
LLKNETQSEMGLLHTWNSLDPAAAALRILPCCGSSRWANQLAARRPFHQPGELFRASDEVWRSLDIADWVEAFSSHPRIGECTAPAHTTPQSEHWSSQEQAAASAPDQETQERLRVCNAAYEKRFDRIYIVCATGRTMQEMLAILEKRLRNDDKQELLEAAEQQRQITQLRLRKWLQL